MELVSDIMHKGGPLMWPIIILLLIGPLISLVFAAMAAFRLRVPAVFWLLAPALATAIGSIGTLQGHVMAWDAVGHASIETRDVLAFAGHSVSLVIEVAGHFVGALLLVVVAWAAAIGHAMRPGEYSEWDIRGALASAFVVCAGSLGLAIWAFTMHVGWELFLVPLTALVVGMAFPVAGLRRGWEHEPRDAGRMGAAASLVVFSGLCAVLLVWLGVGALGESLAFDALAHAAPEHRMSMMSMGRMLTDSAGSIGLVALIVLGVGGLFTAAPPLQDVIGGRSFLSVLMLSPVVLGVVAAEWASIDKAADLLSQTGPERLPPLVAQAEKVPDALLPEGQALPEMAPPFGSPEIAYVDGSWISVDPETGENVGAAVPLDGDTPLLLVKPGAYSRVLTEPEWFKGGSGDLRVMVFLPMDGLLDDIYAQYASFRSVGYRWQRVELPAADEETGEVDQAAILAAGEALGGPVMVEGGSGPVLLTRSGARPLGRGVAILRNLSSELSSESMLVMAPGRRWTVQDLVTYCLAARSEMPPPDRGDVSPRCAILAPPEKD